MTGAGSRRLLGNYEASALWPVATSIYTLSDGMDWLRYFLASLILVPLGTAAMAVSIFIMWLPADPMGEATDRRSATVATTLLILGAGMAVLGGFAPRLKGRFEFGPTGIRGQLEEVVRRSSRERLRELVDDGAVPASRVSEVERIVAETAARLSATSPRRRAFWGQLRRHTVTTRENEEALWERVGRTLTELAVEVERAQDQPPN